MRGRVPTGMASSADGLSSRGDAGDAAQPQREPGRSGPRCPQYGDGAGALLAICWRSRACSRFPSRITDSELRLVAAASRRLVEKLVALDAQADPQTDSGGFPLHDSGRWPVLTEAARSPERSSGRNDGPAPQPALERIADRNRRWDLLPALPVTNLAAELLASRNLLTALAGPSMPLPWMPKAARCPCGSRRRPDPGAGEPGEECCRSHALGRAYPYQPARASRGSGCGSVPCAGHRGQRAGNSFGWRLKRSSRRATPRETRVSRADGWPLSHRGLGLSITRSIVEAAGGRISAANRAQGGARIEIELPVRQAGF